MLKSTLLRPGTSIPRTHRQPEAALRQVLNEDARGEKRQGLVKLAEAALQLGISPYTTHHLSRAGRLRFAGIAMPDGTKENLEVVKQGRWNLVHAESLHRLMEKRDAIAQSTMRLKTMMDKLGITGSTMRRHMAREDGRLYLELPSRDGIMRFEVKETRSTAKWIRADGLPQMKRLFAWMHGKLTSEDLAGEFKPESTYDIHEATLLTGLGRNGIWKMIKRKAVEAELRDGRWRIKGASIQRLFEEHRAAPKDLVGTIKAAKVLGHDTRWISRRLVERDGGEVLEYKGDGASISIPVYSMHNRKGFPLSELRGLREIVEKIPLGRYLEGHWGMRADSVYELFYSRRACEPRVFSVCGQRVEERRCRLVPEYNFPDYDVAMLRVGDAFFVRPEDAQQIALSILLHGGDKERAVAMAELEGMERIPERHYWIARGAYMSTFGHLMNRLGLILGRYDPEGPE